MLDPCAEKPSGDYILRANAILNSMAAGVEFISHLSQATALPVTTIIRTAAILIDDRIIEATAVGDDVRLSIVPRTSPLPFSQ